MANQEFEGRPLWNYGHHDQAPGELAQNPAQNIPICGAKILVYFDDELQEYSAADTSRRKRKKVGILENGLMNFVGGLKEKVAQHIKEVPIQTEHVRKGQIFRANLCFRENVWRDWVIVDWGEDGQLPNKLWGFVDLRELPPND